MNEIGTGPLVPDDDITSPDTNYSVPDGPLHQHTGWPSGITELRAIAVCQSAVRASPVYDQCVQYTEEDTLAYVNGCVADIKVKLKLEMIFL